MVKWSKLDIQQITDFCLSQATRYGVYPSLRDIFYAFVDVLWPNTVSVYQGLSKWLREKRIKGEIDWTIIRDGSGREYEGGDWHERSLSKFIEGQISLFKSIMNYYYMPRWLKQPKHVAVLCEKEADYPVVKSILNGTNIDTGYMRGYSGWRLLFEAKQAFEETGRKPVILALSDFDPSGGEAAKAEGKDMVSFVLKAMKRLDVEADVIKISVTKEQIERFKLPHKPEDAKEIEKLSKDPRFKTWPYGLYRVETAALRTRQPEEFDKILKEAVEVHFDPEIHKEVKVEEEKRRKILKDAIDEAETAIDELEEQLKESVEEAEQ